MMIDDGEFLQFAHRMEPWRNMSPFSRMSHAEYQELFKEHARA
jgi:hypothetical protein